MRQILFRGLRTDGKGWVEGYYLVRAEKHVIWNRPDIQAHEVLPSSVGQFNNIFKCFEGDLLHIGIDEFNLITNDKGEPVKYEVRFDGCEYTLYRVDLDLNWGRLSRLEEMGWCFEVTGNIHEGGKP
jgi:hypothetical protein